MCADQRSIACDRPGRCLRWQAAPQHRPRPFGMDVCCVTRRRRSSRPVRVGRAPLPMDGKHATVRFRAASSPDVRAGGRTTPRTGHQVERRQQATPGTTRPQRPPTQVLPDYHKLTWVSPSSSLSSLDSAASLKQASTPTQPPCQPHSI